MSATTLVSSNLNRRSPQILVILAALHVVFFVGSLVVMPVLAPGAKIPNPFVQDRAAHDLYLAFGIAVRVSSFLQFVSALCLAVLGAFWSQLGNREEEPSSAPALIWVGSLGSALLLSAAALCSWALAAPGGRDLGSVLHTLQFVPFLMGGPGWAAYFGLFLLGICMAGTAILPRWLIWSGISLAAIAELATFVLLTSSASVGLPIARFLGFLWLLLAAVTWARVQTKKQV